MGRVWIGDNVRDGKIDGEAKSTLSFPLTAKEGYSTANVRVRVEGNGFKVDRRYDLPVRPAWPGVLRARTQVLDELAAVSLGSGFASGLLPGSVNARLTSTHIPPIPFARPLTGAQTSPTARPQPPRT